MSTEQNNSPAPPSMAIWLRYLMAVLFGVVVWSGAGNRSADAANPVSAATSYLSFTVRLGANSKFYITDTNRKVICVYSLAGEKLRLVSARKIDHDTKI